MARILMIIAVVAIGGLVSLFTVSSKEVKRYNDAMVALAATVDASFQQITPYMSDYAEGKPIDLAKYEASVASVSRLVADEEAKLSAAKVPDEQECRDFHASLVAYVGNSRRLVGLYEGEMKTYLAAHNPPQDGDGDAVMKIFAEPIAKDQELFAAVAQSQKAMAAKHGIKLQ